MKMPMSEILDRYTITMLKSERTSEDVSEELKTYKEEIDNPRYDDKSKEIQSFVNRLYDINGQMWDAEGGIRSGYVWAQQQYDSSPILIFFHSRVRPDLSSPDTHRRFGTVLT